MAVCACGCVCVWGAARLAGPHPGDSELRHVPDRASGRTKPPAQGLGIQLESHVDTPSQVSPASQDGLTPGILRPPPQPLPRWRGSPSHRQPAAHPVQTARSRSWAQGGLEVTGRDQDRRPRLQLSPGGRAPGPPEPRGWFLGSWSQRGTWRTGERPSMRAMHLGQSGLGTCCTESPDPGPPSLALKCVGIMTK